MDTAKEELKKFPLHTDVQEDHERCKEDLAAKKKQIKEEIELLEQDVKGLGVLDDDQYDYNFADIIQSTDEILVVEHEKLIQDEKLGKYIHKKDISINQLQVQNFMEFKRVKR